MAELAKERVRLARRDRLEAEHLIRAAKARYTCETRELLETGTNPDAIDVDGKPLLWRMVM